MKKTAILFTTLILCSIKFFAQTNQQLFLDSTWYLSKIEVNNEIIYPPFTSSSEFSSLINHVNNTDYFFSQGQCENGVQAQYNFINDNTINISDYVVTAVVCPNYQLELFYTKLNNEIFWNNMNSNFNYIVTSINDYLQLVITGENGNKVYYKNNQTASTKNFENEEFILYPNPTSEILNISTLDFDEIMIFNNSGQKITPVYKSSEFGIQIDIQSLNKGIYILQISKGKQNRILKFIKE